MNTLHRLFSAVLGLAIFGLLCVYLPLQVVDYAASVSAREAGLPGRALFGAMVAAMLLPFAGALWHIFRPATHRWDFRLTELCVRVVLAVPLAVWNAMLQRAGQGKVQPTWNFSAPPPPKLCSRCDGRKWIDAANHRRGDFSGRQLCPECGGTGVGR